MVDDVWNFRRFANTSQLLGGMKSQLVQPAGTTRVVQSDAVPAMEPTTVAEARWHGFREDCIGGRID